MTSFVRKTTRAVAARPLDWLAAILLSWVIPLAPANHLWRLSYRLSLVFWLVPAALLIIRFLSIADKNGRRRRAMGLTTLYVVIAGCVLDFVLGSIVLQFDPQGDYIRPLLPAIGRKGFVPVEEVAFYILGAIAILLTYFWADEFWLSAYHVPRDQAPAPPRGRILDFSPQALLVIGLLFLAVVGLASYQWGELKVPVYATFLLAVAVGPAVVLYRSTKDYVNWRAFSLTTLWVLLTSCIWEVTLALPRQWWGYQERATMKIYIDNWKFGAWAFPVEALFVWVVVTFSAVIVYEAVKTYQYDKRSPRARLFG